jgi:hypothetical protein
MQIILVIAECMGTDGDYSSEVSLCSSVEKGRELARSLIEDMAITMDHTNARPNYTKITGGNEYSNLIVQHEIGTPDWWYRVRVEIQDYIIEN